jgi:hypothetical protein
MTDYCALNLALYSLGPFSLIGLAAQLLISLFVVIAFWD